MLMTMITLPPRILCMCIFFFFHSILSSSLFWLLEDGNHFVIVYFPPRLSFLTPWGGQLFHICSSVFFSSPALFLTPWWWQLFCICVFSSPALFFVFVYLCICLSSSLFWLLEVGNYFVVVFFLDHFVFVYLPFYLHFWTSINGDDTYL